MKLVIVESPTKAKTLSRFLGKGYEVIASMGHVRDLPKKELGVDVDNDFTPKYVQSPKAKKTIDILKKKAEEAEEIYLATDPDREGEAISWHVLSVITATKKPKAKKTKTGEGADEDTSTSKTDDPQDNPTKGKGKKAKKQKREKRSKKTLLKALT